MDSPQPKTKILLVEDEKKLARSMQRLLDKRGYEVELAFDGEEAERKALNDQFGLIILDLGLPMKSGLDVLQSLRSRSYATPVLIVSARDRVSDRVQGLQLGADDYLPKPFDSNELLARIEAILRRSGSSSISILRAADLVMDLVSRTVRRGEKTISLSPREFALLEYFLRHKNQILTRARIAEQVWGYTFETGTNIVDVYVSYVREAVDKGFPKKLIQTVHGQGFVLRDE
jgi:DNA-binding response OmpR family regulator